MTNEPRFPWQDLPDIPDPEPIKQCRVKRMTGVSIENYADYVPFRRCGCKACLIVVERYDGKPKSERKNPRASGRGIPESKRNAIARMLVVHKRGIQDVADTFNVSAGVVQGVKKRIANGDLHVNH